VSMEGKRREQEKGRVRGGDQQQKRSDRCDQSKKKKERKKKEKKNCQVHNGVKIGR